MSVRAMEGICGWLLRSSGDAGLDDEWHESVTRQRGGGLKWYHILYQSMRSARGDHCKRGSEELVPSHRAGERRPPPDRGHVQARGTRSCSHATITTPWSRPLTCCGFPPTPGGSSKAWPRPAPVSGKLTSWSDAARLHAPRLGGLSLLAGDRQGDAQACEPVARRGPSRPFRRHRQT